MKMRLGLVLVSIMLLAGFVNADTKSDCNNIYSNNMEAYYRFEGDLSDTMTTATASHGTSTYETSSLTGTGIDAQTPVDITGNAYMSIGTGGTTSFTIMFWFDPNQANYPGTIMDFVGIFVITSDGAGNLVVNFHSAPVGPIQTSYDSSTPTFVAVTWDQNNFKLFVAEPTDTSVGTSSGDASVGITPSTAIGSGPGDIHFGMLGGSNSFFDEVAFISSTLSSTDLNTAFLKSKGNNNYCHTSSGGVSTAVSMFNIAGCREEDGEGNVVYSLPKGACSTDGYRYCPSTGGDPIDTVSIDNTNACSFGDTDWDYGDAMCCPEDFVCSKPTGYTGYSCNRPSKNCVLHKEDRTGCENDGCYWIDLGLDEIGDPIYDCVANPSDQSCSVYLSENSCVQDTYNLGGMGVGADICNSLSTGFFDFTFGQFVIIDSSCGCKWEDWGNGDPSDDVCELSWNMSQAVIGQGETFSSFECRTNFDMGACIAGDQLIEWDVRTLGPTGVFTTPTNLETAKTEARCLEGQLTRGCGETILKFPGFSLFAGFMSIILIGIFYYFRREFFKE